MKYKAILFDNDDTLMDFQTGNRNAINLLLDEIGYVDDNRYDQYEEENLACWKALERGEMTQNQLKYERFFRFFNKYGITADARKSAERFVELLGMQNMLLPNAEEVLRTISKEIPIGIVTNGITAIQKRRFEGSIVKELSSVIVISEEVGISKPDPAIFNLALEQLKIKPDEALMVGDGIDSDVRGANNAGIDICWINPHGMSLPSELHAEYIVSDIKECLAVALQE
ncbi:YjjG family noncanonical pyrimidine nucleotidase [Butyrivibrio sp. AE3004]|uniref:YjjG family noncanonical pyrimidine nucleotidase n=1 Tax=Butyrivibrio sp. AE3004 TaxID=1506994 RepID=UPI000494467D|nr:YjjG family noncanonical pyrimidine nucleotidase [Butyrivibrio sp. AE3004]